MLCTRIIMSVISSYKVVDWRETQSSDRHTLTSKSEISMHLCLSSFCFVFSIYPISYCRSLFACFFSQLCTLQHLEPDRGMGNQRNQILPRVNTQFCKHFRFFKDFSLLCNINRLYPYENFPCYFTCEKHMEFENFDLWDFHFTYEMGNYSYMKFLIHMWNELVRNFTCGILVYKTSISHMKWNLHIWKLISHTKFSLHLWN